MKHVESIACTGATFASLATSAAELNQLMTTAVTFLTLAWWIRIWVFGEKGKKP